MRPYYILLFILFTISSCQNQNSDKHKDQKRPNILWIVAEDLSPVIPSFGDSTVATPNLSRLAREGVCYDRVFSPSGVCAPSRAAIATGMYPIHIGANHMRTGPWYARVSQEVLDQYAKAAMPPGLKPYEAIPPKEVKMMSEYLREKGYYCTNNAKEDYQFLKSLMTWDESSRVAHWKNRSEGQPFFSIFNIEVTHESRIWAKANDSLWVDSNLDVTIPPYLPQTDSAKIDVRRMYSNIKEMDHQVGKILAELEEEGLMDNTIIFWYTDHGGPLPRQKRLTYDSGLRVPMIIRFPDQREKGTRNGELISFIDFAPTILSIAGIRPPDYLDGQSFLGEHKALAERKFIHAAADRFDESETDPIRTVRDSQYKYIRYYDQNKPMFYHVNYRDQMPIMRELYRLKSENSLTKEQALWFRETKPSEEFFDTSVDPHELNNLADHPDFLSAKRKLSEELDRWLSSIEDLNMKPELELLEELWPDGSKPITKPPIFEETEPGLISIDCLTEGASIGFRTYIGADTSDKWNVYTGPILLENGKKLTAVAHRLGYSPSPITFY